METDSMNREIKEYLPVFAAGTLAAAAVLAPGISVYGIFAALFMFLTAYLEHRSRSFFSAKISMYRQLLEYLERLRHFYSQSGDVFGAVAEAAAGAVGEVREFAYALSQGQYSRNAENSGQDGREAGALLKGRDRYLKLLAAICIVTAEDGDAGADGVQGLLYSISVMRTELAARIRYMEKTRHVFSGYALTAAIPAIAVPYICEWGCRTVEGMDTFYLSVGGNVLKMLSLLISAACYLTVVYLRDGEFITMRFFPKKLKKRFIRSRQKSEILRLKSVIAIELGVGTASPLSLLEAMEPFADVFGDEIGAAAADYLTRGAEALEKLRDRADYLPFAQLADCLVMAEETGCEEAFSGIKDEVRALHEDSELELTMLLEDRGILGMLLAVIPGMFILLAYLLAPFMLNALSLFESYTGKAKELLGQ